ncbi:odorant receptor 4-like [Battus philenor]|uniref:odorant receptor 4-like n=1 Tax=Battus philenor TaxID=42288 RepID=UPI0035D13565
MSMWGFSFKVFTEKVNITDAAYMISICLTSSQACCKACVVLYKKSDIENLLNELASIWRTSHLTEQQMTTRKKQIKTLKRFLFVFYWNYMLGIVVDFSGPLFVVIGRRFILKEHCTMKLPFQSALPYDVSDNWFSYLVTYAFQTFIMLHLVYSLMNLEFLMITFCANLGIEFSLLQQDLESVSSFTATGEQNDLIFNKMKPIKNIVRRHQTLISKDRELRIHTELRGRKPLQKYPQLDHADGMSGWKEVQLITAKGLQVARGAAETIYYYLAVVGISLPMYLLCYYGEFLRNESLGIADAAYNNLWYRECVPYQKMIILLVLRAQRPCCLTAWGQVPVTLNMFTKVMSTTYSYFSVATSVYSGDDDSTD